ncbi:hypothetical protein [Yeosuana sp.]|uniref:hypothetical protein n=1 Tax=Yeosuana sp. TaxID=2529388 RepID=UPI004054FEE8
MAIFNLDIERFILAQREFGKELRGIACIQYPIYCLHTEIKDISPDPLDSLDKSIARVIDSSTVNEAIISNLLSVPVSGVKSRIEQFSFYEYLNDEKTGLSQFGYNTLIKCEEKKVKRKSYDFFIDGISFKPMHESFYSRKYKQAMAEEMEFKYYTDSNGNVKSSCDFSPSIVHTPFDQVKVRDLILSTDENNREALAIPIGLQSIEKISFTKITFPILLALFDKDGEPLKEIIDGFNSLGESENLNLIQESISTRLKNVEMRLDVKRDRESNAYYDFDFTSNWNEIDNLNDDFKLFRVFKEDLKTAFENYYSINHIPIENLITEENQIGINISRSILSDANKPRNIVNILVRGRDYQMTNKFFRTGIWVTFFSFKASDQFTIEILEVFKFIEEAKSADFIITKYIKRFSKYENYREMLIFLEEFELLEEIDIYLNMTQINHDEFE